MGINEPLIDYTQDGKGTNISASFKLAWTKDKNDLFKLIQTEHARKMNQYQLFIGDGDKKNSYFEADPDDEIFQKNIDNRKKFVQYIRSRNIVDVKVIPPSNT